MWINKVDPFYTEEDRKSLAEFDRVIDSFLDEYTAMIRKIKSSLVPGEEVITPAMEDSLRAIQDRREEAERNKEALLHDIEQRYIDSFSGNTKAIILDAQEIVDAIEKRDFLLFYKQREEMFKVLLQEKPGKNSSPEEREQYRAISQLSVKGYTACYYFILNHVNAQLNAVAYYGDKSGEAAILNLVTTKAESFYKKPKNAKEIRLSSHTENRLATKTAGIIGELLDVPNSQEVNLLYQVIGGIDFSQRAQFNRNTKYAIEDDGSKRSITYTSKDATISLEVMDLDAVLSQGKHSSQTKKFLLKVLIRAGEQAIHNGVLTQRIVNIPLWEFVGPGQYKNIDTARKGAEKAIRAITSIRMSVKRKRKGGGFAMSVLFPSMAVNNSILSVKLNEEVNWDPIMSYYTSIPDFAFELSGRAFDLVKTIFDRARQSTKEIKETGSFPIRYRLIQSDLNLPNENASRNPGRDIKGVINDAIEEIEEKYSEYVKKTVGFQEDPELSLIQEVNEDDPIKKYLDDGRLIVTLKGSYAQRFINVQNRAEQHIKDARKKQERLHAPANP